MTTSPQADATASATIMNDPALNAAFELLKADLDSLDTFTVPASRLTNEQLVRAIALCQRELRRRKNR